MNPNIREIVENFNPNLYVSLNPLTQIYKVSEEVELGHLRLYLMKCLAEADETKREKYNKSRTTDMLNYMFAIGRLSEDTTLKTQTERENLKQTLEAAVNLSLELIQ